MRFPFVVRERGRFWALLAATLLAFVIINGINHPLQTSAAPQGIVSFQLAHTVAADREILASWDANARMYAGFSLGFDYLFMSLYMLTLASACTKLADRRWPIGHWLAWVASGAALLDALENAAQWHMLSTGVSAPWPQLTSGCAMAKFILLALCGAYLISATAFGMWEKR